MDKPTFVYVTYIRTTADKVWNALTDAEATRAYWFNHRNASDWKVGSAWTHEDFDNPQKVDVKGTVLERTPPHRLVVSWGRPTAGDSPDEYSRVTFDIVEDKGLVRLTVTHADVQDEKMLKGISGGWPMVLSGLKTMLETGDLLPPIQVREGAGWRTERFGN